MYKGEVKSHGFNDSNVSKNVKVYVGSTQRPFKKDITIIEVALHMKYIDIELVYLCVEIKKNQSTDPKLKWETVKKQKKQKKQKKHRKYKTGDKYYN